MFLLLRLLTFVLIAYAGACLSRGVASKVPARTWLIMLGLMSGVAGALLLIRI